MPDMPSRNTSDAGEPAAEVASDLPEQRADQEQVISIRIHPITTTIYIYIYIYIYDYNLINIFILVLLYNYRF